MEHKYFGILTEEMYNSFSDKEMFNFLNDNNLIELYTNLTVNHKRNTNQKNGFEIFAKPNQNETAYSFSDKLVHEVYAFIKLLIIGSINTNLLIFNSDFEINNFGFSDKKMKKSALKIFKNYFFDLVNKQQIISDKNTGKELDNQKMIPALKKVQNSLFEKLKEEETIITCYLFGYIDHFDKEFLDKDPILLEIYEFENKLNIIIELNKKFQFEKDDIFISKSIAQVTYEKFPDEFDSIEVLEFIELIMNDSKYQFRKFALGLFYALKMELNLTTISAEGFNQLLTECFNCNFKNLSLGNSSAKSHVEKVEMFISKYQIFISKS